MCNHGTLEEVNIINPNQNKSRVVVDACIAAEIRELNAKGIVTLSCCCGHGKAGEIMGYKNGYGKWKERHFPPHALIDAVSVKRAMQLGYRPFPYYYADGAHKDVWQVFLKTGCMTEQDIKEWEASRDETSRSKCLPRGAKVEI